MPTKEKILVIGSSGQIGTELVQNLRSIYGVDGVVASDVKITDQAKEGPFEVIDVMNAELSRKIQRCALLHAASAGSSLDL